MAWTEEHRRKLASKEVQDKRAATILQNSSNLKRVCTLCGEEFTPTHHNQKICKKIHYFPCPVCGKPVEYKNNNRRRCCSVECTKEKRKRTNVELYGYEAAAKNTQIKNKIIKTNQERYGANSGFCTELVRQKYRSHMMQKYGVDNPQKSVEVKAKTRKTNIRKYGGPSPTSSECVKQKMRTRSLERYGVDNPSKSEQVKQKLISTNLSRYGVTSTAKLDWVKEKSKQTKIKHYGTTDMWSVPEIRQHATSVMLEKYGVPWYVMSQECRKGNGKSISGPNRRFAHELNIRSIETSFEFPIEDKSYDVKVGNILVEIDPTSSHNEYMNVFTGKLKTTHKPFQHIEKTKLAEKYGYRCVHIFDWDNINNMYSLVTPASDTIYARRCHVVLVDKHTASEFYTTNHVQGSCYGLDVNIALIHNDDVVQMMSFGRPRYNSNYDYELLRMCSLRSKKVVGGATKLYSYAKKHCDVHNIISYCNRSKFTGNVYYVMGMNLVKETNPNKIWSRGSRYITNNLLLQEGFDRLFGTDYGKGTSNEELMIKHGWWPVYDCGQLVFEDRC